mmetsp:Transcript_93308/g.273139  ORF Transcript_93308/g.273139 Transcript_93308/m.273139 type:complete len:288 (+) Transcript_93308:243-1106(+)
MRGPMSAPGRPGAPPAISLTICWSWLMSARRRATSLAEACPCTSLSPCLNSCQLTLPSPLKSMALKISRKSSNSMLLSLPSSSIFSATLGWRSSRESSSKVRPPWPSSDSAFRKTSSRVSTYAWNRSSSSASSESRLTLVTCSVITPVSKAIMANAVDRMYMMKKRVITGIFLATRQLMSPQLSSVTSWNMVIMLRARVPNLSSISTASAGSPPGPLAQSSALSPTTDVTTMPAIRTTRKKRTPIQKTACMEWRKPCTNRYSCLKCLSSRQDRMIRTMRTMRKMTMT